MFSLVALHNFLRMSDHVPKRLYRRCKKVHGRCLLGARISRTSTIKGHKVVSMERHMLKCIHSQLISEPKAGR